MDEAKRAGWGFDLVSWEKCVACAGQCLVLYFIFSQNRRESSWRQRACAPQASCLINQSPPQIPPQRPFCRDQQAGVSAIHLSAVFFSLLMLTLCLLPFLHRRIQFSDPLKQDSHALRIRLAHTCMRSLTTNRVFLSVSLCLSDNYSAGLTAIHPSLSSFLFPLFCPSSAASFLSFCLSCFYSFFWDESSSALCGVGAHVGPAVRIFSGLSFWVSLL